MSKVGNKLLTAAKEAVAAAKCRHRWERLSTRVNAGRVVATSDRCGKCGVTRTMFGRAPTSEWMLGGNF